MWARRIKWLLRMLRQGEFKILAVDFGSRVYRAFHELIFLFARRRRLAKAQGSDAVIQLKTDFPVAFASPDHLVPWGTQNDNSTNKKFVLHMASLISRETTERARAFLDLGCAGGQLVKDFKDLGWVAVGLEGSDYSLKHKRANWPALGGRNLFTCDITRPFELALGGQPARFDLITAWEVLEHIPPGNLEALFNNIRRHLKEGGYFVASTTSSSDIHDGVELHQCRMTNQEWRALIRERYPELEPVELGLKYYQYVRFNYRERSFLNYRKRHPFAPETLTPVPKRAPPASP